MMHSEQCNWDSGGEAIPERSWYAVQTKPQHERRAHSELRAKGIDAYLPLIRATRQWSDRQKIIEVPAFPLYTFVHVPARAEWFVAVLMTAGVHALVGPQGRPAAIPDGEMESVRRLVKCGVGFVEAPALAIGQRVRIEGGSLDGVTGILEGRGKRLVVGIELLHRAVSVPIDGFKVVPA